VTGNSVKDASGAFPNAAFEANFGTTTNDAPVVHLTLGGAGVLQNDFATSAGQAAAYSINEVRLRERFNTTTHLPGYAGGPTDDAAVANFVAANNILSTSGGEASHVTVSHGSGSATWVGTPLLAAGGGVESASGSPGETHLTQAALDSVVAAAIAHWAAAGLSASQLAVLQSVTLDVVDIPGIELGASTTGHITIDSDAAGKGWFVDPTPFDSSEFAYTANAAETRLFADPSQAPAGHMDLLTTVMHELGHQIGLDDNFDTAAADDLMFGFLGAGERRMPDATDAAVANAAAAPAVVQPVAAGHDVAGTAGADAFVFDTSVLAGAAGFGPALAHIEGYSAAQGDTFDLSALTQADLPSGLAAALASGDLRVAEDASGAFATLQVHDGTGADWLSVAQLDGVHASDPVTVALDAAHVVQLHAVMLA
jgi:hypothetical protein